MKRTTSKYALLCLLALTLLGVLSACTKAQPERVLLLLKTIDNPFFQDIEAGFRSKWMWSGIPVDVLAGKNEADAPGGATQGGIR